MRKVYIQSAEQISIQEPLCERWMTEPIYHTAPLVQAIDPVFRDYIDANSARRMSPIMKRALVTTIKVLNDTGIAHPDAIVTGTSIGCLTQVERFLDSIDENDEQLLKPTYFMQSTHNTVGSTLGIYTKTSSYNTTISHGAISFELALEDAVMQMQLGKVAHALVGGHDEMVEHYYTLLKRAGYVGQANMCPCSEVAVAMMLSTDAASPCLCELAGLAICHNPTHQTIGLTLERLAQQAGLTLGDIEAVMTGVNGNRPNDEAYAPLVQSWFAHATLLRYKHLFGENYTVSALGLYAAAHSLSQGYLPEPLLVDNQSATPRQVSNILLLHHDDNNNFAFILLKKV